MKKMSDNSNLDFWHSVEETNPDHTKRVEYGGRSYVAVDAYYRLKRATGLWGPYGDKWGLKKLKYTPVENLMLFTAEFYCPLSTFEISNTIKSTDPDFAKKIETDTLTKALSKLGFCSDVYQGMFDDDRYVNEVKYRRTQEEKKAILLYKMDKYKDSIETIKTALAEDNMSTAAEAHVEIGLDDVNNEEVKALWIAPTTCMQKFGIEGPFTTQERSTMKSDDFAKHIRDFKQSENS